MSKWINKIFDNFINYCFKRCVLFIIPHIFRVQISREREITFLRFSVKGFRMHGLFFVGQNWRNKKPGWLTEIENTYLIHITGSHAYNSWIHNIFELIVQTDQHPNKNNSTNPLNRGYFVLITNLYKKIERINKEKSDKSNETSQWIINNYSFIYEINKWII